MLQLAAKTIPAGVLFAARTARDRRSYLAAFHQLQTYPVGPALSKICPKCYRSLMPPSAALIESHLEWYIAHAAMRGYGPLDSPVWMSSIDLQTGRASAAPRPPGIEKRCYRFIESPLGSNLYWDLPLVAFCYQFSEITGRPRYRETAERYLLEYLSLATCENGLFYWGNHYYIQAATGKIVWFIDAELFESPPPPLITKPGRSACLGSSSHRTRPRPPNARFALSQILMWSMQIPENSTATPIAKQNILSWKRVVYWWNRSAGEARGSRTASYSI